MRDILYGLNTKAILKQKVFRNTLAHFQNFKEKAKEIAEELAPEVLKKDKNVEIEFADHSDFEFSLKFSGDTLVFQMHTNVFSFDDKHAVNQLDYVKENQDRGYFGMIHIYNFLSDSLKYNRSNDLGFIIGRLFVNIENHFYVEGVRQLNFLFKNLTKDVLDPINIEKVIEQSMLYSLDFDLQVPPIQQVEHMTVAQKNHFNAAQGSPTTKRLGFHLNHDD